MIRSAVLIQYTRVTERRTDRQTELAWHIRAITYMLSRVKTLTSLVYYDVIQLRYNLQSVTI